MQYFIRMICDESLDFRRDLLIDEDATFLDLSNLILRSCNYPDDQMTSFYICNEEWERKEQITREDVREGDADEDLFAMGDVRLSEFLGEERCHFEYVFDPFGDRAFSLSVREQRPGSGEAEVVKAIGMPPVQISSLDIEAIPGNTAIGNGDFSDDFGIESFNSDEIDLEGFEITDNQN